MKLRYMFLFLVALVLAPVTTSFATETTKGGEEYNPDALCNFNDWQMESKNERLAFDDKGRVTAGVVTYTCQRNLDNVIACYDVVSDEGNCLLIAPNDKGGWCLYGATSSGSLTGSYSGWRYWGRSFKTFFPLSQEDGLCVFPLGTRGEDLDTSGVDGWIGGGWGERTDYVIGFDFTLTTDISSVYSFWTNIPVFQDRNSDACMNYILNGDYSGASNASDVDEAKKAIYPDNKYEMEKGPYLKVDSYDGSNLTIRPAKDAYCSWSYTPQKTDLYSDLTLDVIYDYQLSLEYLNNANLGKTISYKASGSFPLSDYNFSYNCYPIAVCGRYGWITDQTATGLMFGGKANLNVGATFYGSASATTDLIEVTGSFLTVTFKLKGKYNGDWVNGPAVIEKVDLINRTCTERPAYSDEEGNYTVDEEEESITRDENGDVVINNNVSGGGGGSSSSATGGNANVTIGDITSSSTFRFPDKMTIDLNIKGLDGTGGGGSSGSSEESDKKWYDRLLDAIGSLIEFLTEVVTKLFEALGDLLTTFADSVGDFIQYLFEGFGLFKNDGGIGSLIQDNYSFVPPDVWRLVMFGIASVILVSIVNRFF